MANFVGVEQLFQRKVTCFSLGSYFGDDRVQASRRGLDVLAYFEVVPTTQTVVLCPNCPNPTRMAVCRDSRGLGFRWRCPGCQRRMSPMHNTFVEQFRAQEVGYDAIVKLAYFWLMGRSQSEASEEIGIATDTANAWYRYFRDVALKAAWHDFRMVGDDRDVVEIDETHLFKRKYNRGRMVGLHHVWALGGISRTTKKVFGCLVPDRSADTLTERLVRHVDDGAYVCSDQWAAYGHIIQYFAGHGRVNHSRNFVNPPREEEPIWFPADRFHELCFDAKFIGPQPENELQLKPFRIHTQTIESAWRGLKETLRSHERVEEVEGYIGEWMYRRNILHSLEATGDRLRRLFADCRRAFPGVGKQPMNANMELCVCSECA